MKARKAMALAMTAAMVGGLMTVPVMAEENAELLPGGGSKIIYCITPSTSNPFFNTEQVIAKEKAEELGYEVKCASHDDDAATQLELFEAAINDGAAAIICDNAGADASIEAVQKAYDAGIPASLLRMPRMYLSVETSPFISTSALPATTAATACCTHFTSLASSTMLNALMSMSFSDRKSVV